MHEILFPSPFGTPPSPELVARARLAPVPAGFTGRAGVLVFEDEAGVHAEHAFEPVSREQSAAFKDHWLTMIGEDPEDYR